MSMNYRLWITIQLSFLFCVHAGLVQAQDPCLEGEPLIPGEQVRSTHWQPGARCYTIEISGSGTLLLEARADGELRLDVTKCGDLGSANGGSRARVRDRWAARWLADLSAAGRYAACLSFPAPDAFTNQDTPGVDFKLSSAFAAAPPSKSGDPDEDEPEPEVTEACSEPTSPDCSNKGGDPDEDEPEPEHPFQRDPLQRDSFQLGSLQLERAETQSLCLASMADTGDDYSDLFHCAHPVLWDSDVLGKLGNPWGDDEDVFRLSLHRLKTVRVTVTGDEGIEVELYDGFGQRLAAPESKRVEAGRGKILVPKTLVPGSYFIRLSSPGTTAEAYRLSVTSN